MSAWNKFQDMINERKNKIVNRNIEKAENVAQNTGFEEALEIVLDTIRQNPDMATEIIAKAKQSGKLKDQVAMDAMKEIPNIEQIENPEETLVETAEKTDFNTTQIKEIIKETDMSLKTAKKVAEQIPNDEIRKAEKARLEEIEREERIEQKRQQEQELNKELKEMYVNCKGIRDTDILTRLEEIKKQNRSLKVKEIITRILARKAAIEFRQVGNTRLFEMKKVVTPEEMLESKFPDLVQEEFEQIKDIKAYKGIDGKQHKYNKEILMQGILSEIAKNVASTFNDVGVIDIPQSEAMKEITDEQEKYFISQIQIYGKDITDIEKIKNQIRGIVSYQMKDLEEMIKKVPEDEIGEYVQSFKAQIAKGKQKGKKSRKLNSEIEGEIDELKDLLAELDSEDALDILEIVKNKTQERVELKDKQSDTKINEADKLNQNGISQSDDDENLR